MCDFCSSSRQPSASEIGIYPGVCVCVCVGAGQECACVCTLRLWLMYSTYQEREELEDELYKEAEGDSEDANSELEFHLYSQLHYSSNAGEVEELEDKGEKVEDQNNQQLNVTETTAKGDKKLEQTEESRPPTPTVNKLRQHLKKKGDQRNTQKKGKSDPKGQRLSSFLEEVIVIDSSPDVISISEDDSADDEGVCALKGKGLHRLQTSTPAQQVRAGVSSSLCDYFIIVLLSTSSVIQVNHNSDRSTI